ncbi:helix-turn-helix domain-containing protein [Chitinophaga oryziterrae]|uniref:Helix-turn-helix domain-containing protein n=1 Tax=Chitinophaga oryziterrae TaxID=1031224 RepID=A0A6N8J8N8_9BACT|nr:helix-turn-helix domain-containing protein [Chitinophaga oryziterrae]MVT41645.1 helix-turn-helix domain-containing protein [Chitinophaga oryziterrae]
MKQVTILVPSGYANLASIVGTFQILTRANEYWQKIGNKSMMEVRIAGFVSELKLDGGFFSIFPIDLNEVESTDLVIIPSVSHEYDRVIRENAALISWIRGQYKDGAEIASICTGAFLLAATGLLEGKACSTHWNAAAAFRRLFPNVTLHTDQLLTAGLGIYTNGGAYSFLNLVLFLVEKYFDRATAVFCSKVFQIDMDRTSQSPFFIFQAQKAHGDELISKAQTYIEENLTQKISFEQIASELAISRRNFDRRFIKATGNTPLEYMQRVKVEVAKSNLEKGRKSVFEIMDEVGYADDKSFREVFKKISGLSPLEYRAKYNKNASQMSDPSRLD